MRKLSNLRDGWSWFDYRGVEVEICAKFLNVQEEKL